MERKKNAVCVREMFMLHSVLTKIYRGFDDVVVDTMVEMTDDLSLTGASKRVGYFL